MNKAVASCGTRVRENRPDEENPDLVLKALVSKPVSNSRH